MLLLRVYARDARAGGRPMRSPCQAQGRNSQKAGRAASGLDDRPAIAFGVLRLTLAALHLIALGLGLGAVIARGTALRESPTVDSLRRAFRADTMWGIAAGLWIATGLWRWLGATEKATGYYLENHYFLGKMGFFGLIFALEVVPMITLIRWRKALGSGRPADTVHEAAAAKRIAVISHIQALLVVVMVFFAAAMARGYGGR